MSDTKANPSIRVLTEPELLEELGISDRTFDRMRAVGDTPPKTQLSARRVGYRVCDVEAWLDARRDANWKSIGDAARRVVTTASLRKTRK